MENFKKLSGWARLVLSGSILFAALGANSLHAAEFEGKLDFFSDIDMAYHPKEGVSNRNQQEDAWNPGGPKEVGQTTEVTIQLEKKMPSKKMPSMQGAGDKIFQGYDPLEEDPFEKDKVVIPPVSDPMEGFNRSVTTFNDSVYENLLKPVATTYRDLVHEEVRIAVRNLFNNALAPVKLVSSLVQLDLEKSGRVVGRTIMNTTLGWGGMLDVAGQEYGIEDVNEDFNQALGYHGVPPGPYVVLPFLGPSTVRGVVGRVVDSFLSPTIVAAPGFAVGAAMSGSKMVNDTSFRIEDIEQLKKDAVDPYISMRDFYHQYTERQVLK